MKPITATEKRILDLVGQGMSSVQIAQTLDVSAHTVESHRRTLLTKFGAKNSAEMMKKAVEERVFELGELQSKTISI
jgi:DNA-binding CsgD family transcriptional regulator